MDKSIYHQKIEYKIFGKTMFEREIRYEGIELKDVEPLCPIINMEIDINQNKEN